MVTKQLIKTTRLTKNELRSIRNLIQSAGKKDKYHIRMYWNIVYDRQLPDFDDYLYYIDGKLAAYMAVYVFKSTEAEISAVVAPQHRRQGIFKQLVAEAKLDLERRGIKKVLLIGNNKGKAGLDFIKKHSGEYDHSECEMVLRRKISIDNLPQVALRPAKEADLDILVKIDSKSFNTNPEQMRHRFGENMKEKHRMQFIATVDGQDVGKTHVRVDHGEIAFIHDLGVPPKHRRKRYAMAMVFELIKLLRQKGYGKIALDVVSDNEAAIKLYEACGFDIEDQFDFYRLLLKEL